MLCAIKRFLSSSEVLFVTFKVKVMAMVKGIPGVNQYCRAFVVFTRDLRCTTGSLRLKSFCDYYI